MIFRYWLIMLLFTDSEKYIIKRAIDDRVDLLYRILINEKWVDKDNIKTDIKDYKKLKGIFSTESWK